MAIGGYTDKHLLSTDSGFQSRVEQSLIAACVSISGEAASSTPYHAQRATYATAVLNNPGSFMPLFSLGAANDANVVSDATQASTVGLTSGNVAAQAALVTDAHIDSAVSGQFNAFAGAVPH